LQVRVVLLVMLRSVQARLSSLTLDMTTVLFTMKLVPVMVIVSFPAVEPVFGLMPEVVLMVGFGMVLRLGVVVNCRVVL
jgi:hypothetical protein